MAHLKFIAIVGALAVICVLVARPLTHAVIRAVLRVKPVFGQELNYRDRVVLRYENQHFHPWMFAWFKTRLDPMFDELPVWFKSTANPRAILDLGCGFGFTSSFLLDWFPEAEIFGVEPSATRVAVASKVLGPRAHVFHGAAPDFEQPDFPAHFDAVIFLDVLHFLSDADLDLTLQRIRSRLNPGDYLIIRAPIIPGGVGSLMWHGYQLHRILTGTYACFRTVPQVRERMSAGGFDILTVEMSGKNPELFWFISTASPQPQQ